jgi:hypothetical protein
MSMHQRILGAALVAAALGAGASARADAVPPPPAECPAGTRGETDHYGPHCTPADCQTDADCPGQRCQPYALCVFDRVFESPRGNTHRREAKGACNAGQKCPLDSPCRPGNYCFAANVAAPPPTTAAPSAAAPSSKPAPTSPPAADKSSCTLRAPGLDRTVGALAIGIGVAALCVVRTRRRGQ